LNSLNENACRVNNNTLNFYADVDITKNIVSTHSLLATDVDVAGLALSSRSLKKGKHE